MRRFVIAEDDLLLAVLATALGAMVALVLNVADAVTVERAPAPADRPAFRPIVNKTIGGPPAAAKSEPAKQEVK